ncbi:MAG: hypothetical protein EXR72_00955 [Myxococcales bacterium]|nr:hypothetical protein [Myxococcales bacterium]
MQRAADDCMSGSCANHVCAPSKCGCAAGSYCKNGVCLCDGRSCGSCGSSASCGAMYLNFQRLEDGGRGTQCDCHPMLSSCLIFCPKKCCAREDFDQPPSQCVPLANLDLCRNPKMPSSACIPCPCN